MKAYSDFSQSKELAKILPLESADMEYCAFKYTDKLINEGIPYVKNRPTGGIIDAIPCWSLAALLEILDNIEKVHDNNVTIEVGKTNRDQWCVDLLSDRITNQSEIVTTADKLIDACYEMIIKLKDRGLL